ncbi:hypothetical protein [Microvirga subterranea]|uniref:Uncharacterized protein n=1 Tax=Microvirga subterranea TaxID=186651 RepID=A0A370HN45_9HYPH|nr:hypothetical protein [Microvirga subterranea]RDI59939.1 hypothetical protein DES45_103195 [Microvirga subterranea]
MTTELHEGPLETAPAVASTSKLTWRQQRAVRRRRRVWFEEVLGWILVPLILFGCYWFVELVLSGMGTSIGAIIDGLSNLRSNL